jgi:hypothetical protein
MGRLGPIRGLNFNEEFGGLPHGHTFKAEAGCRESLCQLLGLLLLFNWRHKTTKEWRAGDGLKMAQL